MSAEQDQVTTALRRLTPAQRWHVAQALYWEARRWKAAVLRSLHPDWPDAKVEAAVREQFLRGTTA